MKKLIPIYLMLLLLVVSCKDDNPTFTEESITITENVVLGSDMDSMYQDFKDRNVNSGTFYTRISFNDYSEANENIIGMYYTDIFNLSNYSNSIINLNHYGFLYPTKLTGTNRLLGMNILLVSTQKQLFTSNVKLNAPSVLQEVNELLIKDIENLFNKKYGKPIYRIKRNYYPVFHIEGKQIKEYASAGAEGEIVSWENDFMTIEFFKGIKSYETSFDPNTPQYSFEWIVGGEPKQVIPSSANVYSYSMPYISYQLKDTTVKILGLEKKLNL